MELKNYLETLSQMQKWKWEEKVGTLMYYDIFEMLHTDYSLEESGALLLGLIYYDMTGGAKPLPKDIENVITKGRATRIIFKTYADKIAAASKMWINRHKLQRSLEELKIQNGNEIVDESQEAKNEETPPEDEDLPF